MAAVLGVEAALGERSREGATRARVCAIGENRGGTRFGPGARAPYEKSVITPTEGNVDPAHHAWVAARFATDVIGRTGALPCSSHAFGACAKGACGSDGGLGPPPKDARGHRHGCPLKPKDASRSMLSRRSSTQFDSPAETVREAATSARAPALVGRKLAALARARHRADALLEVRVDRRVVRLGQ